MEKRKRKKINSLYSVHVREGRHSKRGTLARVWNLYTFWSSCMFASRKSDLSLNETQAYLCLGKDATRQVRPWLQLLRVLCTGEIFELVCPVRRHTSLSQHLMGLKVVQTKHKILTTRATETFAQTSIYNILLYYFAGPHKGKEQSALISWVIRPLNVYTGQNPRQPVVLIEIQPNVYSNYLSQTAGVNLHSLGWFISVYWKSYLWHKLCTCKLCSYKERIWHKENKQADRFLPICVHIVRIWLVSLRTTCRLGFCLVYTFNAYDVPSSAPHVR